MNARLSLLLTRVAASLIVLAVAAPLSAQTPTPGVQYQLVETAMFEAGCLPPCMCPVSNRAPLKGTFRLVNVPVDGPFELYQVLDVDWTFTTAASTTARAQGSGTYRRNAPSQGLHQLVLDLSVDGGEVQRYESGLVEGADDFPAFELPVALHGFFCHDSVYGVHAVPRTTDVSMIEDRQPLSAGPNPFTNGTEIGFMLASPARIDLRIYDLAGREVRQLSDWSSLPAGVHRMGWDGKRSGGRVVPAGIYFARLRGAGAERSLTLVKRE